MCKILERLGDTLKMTRFTSNGSFGKLNEELDLVFSRLNPVFSCIIGLDGKSDQPFQPGLEISTGSNRAEPKTELRSRGFAFFPVFALDRAKVASDATCEIYGAAVEWTGRQETEGDETIDRCRTCPTFCRWWVVFGPIQKFKLVSNGPY